MLLTARCPFCDDLIGSFDLTEPDAETYARHAAEAHLHTHVDELVEELDG